MWTMAQQFLQKTQFFWKKNQRGLRNGKIWRGTPWTNEKVAFGHHIRRSMKDHAVFHIDLGWLVIQNKVDWKRGSKCTHLCTFYSQLIINTSSSNDDFVGFNNTPNLNSLFMDDSNDNEFFGFWNF